MPSPENPALEKPATTDYPVHDLIRDRWSPRAFADRDVSKSDLGSLFEAARWASSCFNAQPWRFLVTTREDRAGFDRMAECLMDGNAWAKQAPVLLMTVAQLNFERNGKPNRHAYHDVGLAIGGLVTQAQALGLSLHQMAGFDAEAARAKLDVPDGFDPLTMIAIGYQDDPSALPEALAERERAPRERKPLDEIVFGPGWGSARVF